MPKNPQSLRRYAILYVRTDSYGVDTRDSQIKWLMEYILEYEFEFLVCHIEAHRDEYGVRYDLKYLDQAIELCLQNTKPEIGVECSLFYINFDKFMRNVAFTRRIKLFKKKGGVSVVLEAPEICAEYAQLSRIQQDKEKRRNVAPLEKITPWEKWRSDNGIDKRQWRNFVHIRHFHLDVHIRNGILGPPAVLLKKRPTYTWNKLSYAEMAKQLNKLGLKTVNGKRWSKETIRQAWKVILTDEFCSFVDAINNGTISTGNNKN